MEKYCSCVVDEIVPTLYSSEFEKAVKEGSVMNLLLEDDNFIKIAECVHNNTIVDESFSFSNVDYDELSIKMVIEQCVIELNKDPELQNILTKELAEDYCKCMYAKLIENGITYEELIEIENENGIAFNEVAVPCLNEILEDMDPPVSTNTYNKLDIKGINYSSEVQLSDYLGQGYKLKISIDGITNYYLFDTGASGFVINRNLERELLLNETLNRDDYIGKEYYSMANGDIIEAQLVKINNVKIGSYVVNNVVAAILGDGALLCGKGLLDKFRKWEVDMENEILILYK